MTPSRAPAVSPGTAPSPAPPGPVRVREPDPDPAEQPVDDVTLVRRSLEDAEAFGILYERYCDRVFRYVLRRLPDRATAEDVTAEVFIKAMRGLEGYRPQGAPFSAWLFRIAANATTDHLRARKFTEPLDAAPDRPERADLLEDRVARRVDADRAWAAVDRLTDAQRTAVILRLAHDQTVPEIARRMNRSEGAVKLLLNRGLSAARTYLQESGTELGEPATTPHGTGPARIDPRTDPRSGGPAPRAPGAGNAAPGRSAPAGAPDRPARTDRPTGTGRPGSTDRPMTSGGTPTHGTPTHGTPTTGTPTTGEEAAR